MNRLRVNKLAVAVALTTSAFTQLSTVAAETPVLEEVIVTGVRASLARAIDQKRASTGIEDAISAEDVGDFPDLNVSESLARITGVTISRNLGEGSQVSVRGLRPEFTQVLINGQTVTSGNDGREVDFDVFASELFTGLAVAKSHDASQVEGGLAGTISLRTARPFDLNNDDGEPSLVLSVQGAQNEMADEIDPRITALGSAELMDGRLGLLGSVAYSETNLRQDNVEGLRFKLVDADVGGVTQQVEYPFIPRYLVELKERDRLGVTGAVQFEVSHELALNLDVGYAEFDEVRTRHSIDGLIFDDDITDSASTIESVDSTGLITRATLDNVTSRSENILTPSSEDLILIGLDATWEPVDNWSIYGKIGHSKATKEEREFRSTWNNDGTFFFDLTDKVFLGIGQVGQDITDSANYDDRHEARLINTEVEDEDTSFQIDVDRTVEGSSIAAVKLGIRINDREKSKAIADDQIRVTGVSLVDYMANFPVGDFYDQEGGSQIVRSWPVSDFNEVLSDPVLVPSGFAPAPKPISSFNVTEESFAGYIQAVIDGELGDLSVRGHLGARVVNTEQISSGTTSSTPISVTKTYTEVLPSFALSFELSENLLYRIAAAKSLTRPTLTDLTPGGTIATGVNDATFGNPNLDPYTADNYDMSLEWYFGEEALASIALFHKDVSGFVSRLTSDGTLGSDVLGNDPRAGESFSVSRPVNGKDAYVQGYELSLQTPFSFLPAPFDGFGIQANYTYSDSESTISLNDGSEVVTPMVGQSESSYNFVGYYENDTFSARLAYTWRGDYLDEIRLASNERSNHIADYGQLDMNIQYNLNESITFSIDALNLLEEEELRYGELESRNVRYSETGRFFIVGVRAKF